VKILIVDPEEKDCQSIAAFLNQEGDYQCETARNEKDALQVCEQGEVNLLITEIKFSDGTGQTLIRKIHQKNPEIEIIVLTAHYTDDGAMKSIKHEAIHGFIKKPFRMEEVAVRVSNSQVRIEKRRQEIAHRKSLEKQLKKQERELVKKNNTFILELIQSLNNTLESRDRYTYGHSIRVSRFSRLLLLDAKIQIQDPQQFFYAAMLHDIGKIGISDLVLNKPGKLSKEEFDVIKTHPVEAIRILRNISNADYIKKIIRHHHERIDGGGYPDGIKGEEIPIESRIISIVDTFDALMSDRPYRKGMEMDKAISIIRENLGTQLDSQMGKLFIDITARNFNFINSILKDFDQKVFINY